MRATLLPLGVVIGIALAACGVENPAPKALLSARSSHFISDIRDCLESPIAAQIFPGITNVPVGGYKAGSPEVAVLLTADKHWIFIYPATFGSKVVVKGDLALLPRQTLLLRNCLGSPAPPAASVPPR